MEGMLPVLPFAPPDRECIAFMHYTRRRMSNGKNDLNERLPRKRRI